MPLQQTSGNDTSDAYGGGAAVVPAYIEDMFSTWLYTGTGAAQTITNNIDLSTKSGMVWIKNRTASQNNNLFDTTQGATKLLHSNTGDSTVTDANSLTAFNTTGFTLGTGNTSGSQVNTSAATYASWTFRKQSKFFDIVTWTGSGTPGRTISHSLGAVPGCIMVKCTSTTYSWFVYHKDANAGGATTSLSLASTTAAADEGNAGIQNLTTTTFQLGGSGAYSSRLDDPSATYVAYIYASNAGGFGLTGTDNVITCGTYTGNGSTAGPVVNLGYEPQWILIKCTDNVGAWWLQDNMRGLTQTSGSKLETNTNTAEVNTSASAYATPIATGFSLGTSNANINALDRIYVYVAIRRGPMKVPTDATKVFNATTSKPPASGLWGATNLVDFSLAKYTNGAQDWYAYDRLRGYGPYLATNLTNAESVYGNVAAFARNSDWYTAALFGTSGNYTGYFFSRAPGFFDVVCYTGDGTSNRSVNHNLGVTPELYIIKGRAGTTAVDSWAVYNGFSGVTKVLRLETTAAVATDNWFGTVAPSASYFSCNADYNYDTTSTYVCYLFATLAGVSKVGTYTGNGSTQTINCGFTGGARFVLIKRTDAVGDWYVYDTARGMTTLTDPYFRINSDAAQTATLGSVTTVTTGFALDATIVASINTNAATYIFLAIA